jgi:hypothetical protein
MKSFWKQVVQLLSNNIEKERKEYYLNSSTDITELEFRMRKVDTDRYNNRNSMY